MTRATADDGYAGSALTAVQGVDATVEGLLWIKKGLLPECSNSFIPHMRVTDSVTGRTQWQLFSIFAIHGILVAFTFNIALLMGYRIILKRPNIADSSYLIANDKSDRSRAYRVWASVSTYFFAAFTAGTVV